MHWHDIPYYIEEWSNTLDPSARALRKVASAIFTDTDAGYYLDPFATRTGVYLPAGTGRADRALVKSAAESLGNPVVFLSYQDLAAPTGHWIKVAYSPMVRRLGELTNFFPGQYAEGVPNAPSPVAAMLTAGLLGAGLGWGGGKLAQKVLPKKFGDKLPRTGLILGGLLGAAPGAAWGGANKLIDRPFNDPALLDAPRDVQPINYPGAVDGANMVPDQTAPGKVNKLIEDTAHTLHSAPIHRIKLGAVELSEWCKHAIEKVADTFGVRDHEYDRLPTDVNIDALGRTLWDTGASPALAGTTMGAMYAAQQMPDQRSRPGTVTGNQLGQLAANAVGDYAKGYLAGFALNQVVGTPFRNSSYGLGNVALGVIGAVVPKLFGG